MATKPEHPTLVPSLLDRLVDDGFRASRGRVNGRWVGARDYVDAVKKDLEELFNTRQFSEPNLETDYPETFGSIATYGLPDLANQSVSSESDVEQLRAVLQDVICRFEPRLLNVRVSVGDVSKRDRKIAFRVSALVNLRPTPEPVTFDASLDRAANHYDLSARG